MRVIAHQPTGPLQDHPVLVIERRALDRDRDLTGRQPRFVDCLDARRHLAALLVQYQRAESAHSLPPPLTDPTRDGSLLPARTTSQTCAAAEMIDFSDHGIPALPGAVSLGGVLAALTSPLIGPLVDRYGSRAALSLAVLVTAAAMMLLSLTQSLLVFYLLFCVARMVWAGPFELAIYGALNNWFVSGRALATSIATVAQMAGLVAMPLIAQLVMQHSGWRFGWLAIGSLTLVAGFLPVWLFMVRRPEDLGLVPDPQPAAGVASHRPQLEEPSFSRREAIGTAAFWLLLLYTVLVYPVQAGVSLHQAAHLIERGVAPTIAAMIVSTFSLMSALASLACAFLPRSLPIRYPLALIGGFLAAGAVA